jgi:DNA adenine methylase
MGALERMLLFMSHGLKPLDPVSDDLSTNFERLDLSPQVNRFPSTRFMGSKEKLLAPLWAAISQFSPKSVLDLCSGSGVVSYMLKAQGQKVISNDYMRMATTIADATIANSHEILSQTDITKILDAPEVQDGFIWHTYREIYYKELDVKFLDKARIAILTLKGAKQSIAMAALIRACIKRRPRGIFTYTGDRYDDGRKDLKLSLAEHFILAVEQINNAIIDNGTSCEVQNVDLSHNLPDVKVDTVYLDPPYFSPLSDNEYVRRYHFTEALARNWEDVEIQSHTKTKKISNYPSPFRSEVGCVKAIGEIIDFYHQSSIVMSYSSNSLPTASTILALFKRHGRRARLIEVDHRYSFANQGVTKAPVRNQVKELIFSAE